MIHSNLSMMAAAVFDFSATRKAFEAEIHEAEKVSSMTLLQERFMKLSGSETEKKSTLDQAFRDVLKDHIVKESGCDVYLSVISLAVDCAKEGLCLGMIPFLMLDDVFSSVTLDVCERVFKFVEDGVPTWKKEPYYTGGKNYLLRMCNDLLRRLSRSQNTVFCGRIQLFLARLFPLEEKSGLNLQSHFNLENVTSYNLKGDDSTMRSEDRDRDESMEMEEGEMSDSHSSFTPIDYNLYRKFWSIQDFFRNPNQCYKKDLWKSFASNSDEVLKCFESHKLDDIQASKKKKEMLAGGGGNVYFAKYLTSEKLLDLQLADSNFRRYVLVQFLILFQYLNAEVKFKAPNLVVSDEQALWIKNATDMVYKLLRETPPDGDHFAKMVQHTLEREENWITWKNKGCPTYDRERPKTETPLKKSRKRAMGEDIKEAEDSKRVNMGSAELTRLWNLCPDNMEACSSAEREFLPSLEEFFEEAIEQSDPEAMVEDEYKVVNNPNFGFRALKLLACRSPHFFQPTNNQFKTLPSYLENILSKLAKELPSPSEELKTDTDMAENEELLDEKKSDSPQGAPPLTQEHIDVLAEKLGADWKKLAPHLDFKGAEITAIEGDSNEMNTQATQLLVTWQDREGPRATVDIIMTALEDAGMQEISDVVFGEGEEAS